MHQQRPKIAETGENLGQDMTTADMEHDLATHFIHGLDVAYQHLLESAAFTIKNLDTTIAFLRQSEVKMRYCAKSSAINEKRITQTRRCRDQQPCHHFSRELLLRGRSPSPVCTMTQHQRCQHAPCKRLTPKQKRDHLLLRPWRN